MNAIDDAGRPTASRKQRAALASIAASALLALAKLAAGLWSGSLSLLSEAGHAGVDTGATILTYFAVREADKPADAEHHYGHGKYESLAALVETGLLFGLALFVVSEAVRRLQEPSQEADVNAGWPAFAVLGVSILVDLVRSLQLSRVAKEEGSDALAADALHFASDLISSVLVVIGLGAMRLGFERGDAIAAIGVALFIAIAGFRLGRRTIETLLDAAPSEFIPRMRAVITEAPGVIALEKLRLRQVGRKIVGEATISVSRNLSVDQAERINQGVAAAISAFAPDAEITLIAAPRPLDDETVIERTRLVAARRRLPVHHIVAQEIEGRLSISLDLEVDGGMSLRSAHGMASELEEAIRDEFGADVEIETHIEPAEPQVMVGRDVDSATRETIEAALERCAAEGGVLRHVHDVRVRGVNGGLVVNYHCEVDGALSVEAAHDAVDAVELALRQDFARILTIAGHCEPLGANETA
ncbi:MAG: cation diffusion facilitator family transporter [Methylocystis sp.]